MDFTSNSAAAFVITDGSHFVSLRMSGLVQVGPPSGWLSPEYPEELFFIDDHLSSLLELVIAKRHYFVIITHDHVGHGKIHGSNHAEDYRLPLIVCSDTVYIKRFQYISFSVIKLKKILEDIMEIAS